MVQSSQGVTAMSHASEQSDRLVRFIAEFPSCVVAFSGGVDSAVVAKAAYLAVGDNALAVTGVSASLADGELETARRIAKSIGIRHKTVATDELNSEGYLENSPNRCWHCKTELYSQLSRLGGQQGFQVLLNGANSDDAGDFRPGMRAATEHQVRSPLLECDIDKAGVREVAKYWDLEVWDKPATPCLSSRVVYGLEITPERLQRIDSAEKMLRELGLHNVRVRHHHDDLARIEIAPADVSKLCTTDVRQKITQHFKELGFSFVTVDLEGFRSGSFLPLVPEETLHQQAD